MVGTAYRVSVGVPAPPVRRQARPARTRRQRQALWTKSPSSRWASPAV